MNAINVESEQCYTITGPEKDCDKKVHKHRQQFKSNNRPYNALLLIVKDNTVDYLLSGMANNEPVIKDI